MVETPNRKHKSIRGMKWRGKKDNTLLTPDRALCSSTPPQGHPSPHTPPPTTTDNTNNSNTNISKNPNK
jgi:hypothetical protein